MSDLEIARATTLRPISEIANAAGLPADALYAYGPYKAKIGLDYIASLKDKPRGKLILVTAISPTPAGEGKTTTTIGLGDALRSIGKRSLIALREPSLGPCFGQKGGATGGGYAQVAPMDEINLHFTGDFHAITSANNLLAALIDNHIYYGNKLGIDPSKVSWRRCMDMNDRALRDMVVALGGNGQLREDAFDITVASEVMAIFCLATSLADLEHRIDRIVVARDFAKKNVTAKQIQAAGAMSVLLRDAIQPNLVQTLEHTPAFVHGGPFANIAHGCNSVIATRTALKLADYVVTEAGFGADLGAEKFFDIKCRQSGLTPSAAVIVATVRALKMHGGVDKKELGRENVDAVKAGTANLLRHIENVRKFGVPVTVAINHFTADTKAETDVIAEACRQAGVHASPRPRRTSSPRPAAKPACMPISAATGPTAARAPRAWRTRSCGFAKRAARSSRSIPTTCRSSTRSAPSRARSIAPPISRSRPTPPRSSSNMRATASDGSPSAWRRRSTASPPSRTCAARRRASSCRCATCGCRRARASSWRCAAT